MTIIVLVAETLNSTYDLNDLDLNNLTPLHLIFPIDSIHKNPMTLAHRSQDLSNEVH